LNYTGAMLILAPGIYIARCFMPSRFATPGVRLAIISIELSLRQVLLVVLLKTS